MAKSYIITTDDGKKYKITTDEQVQPSMGESAYRGAIQGATLGWGDELAGLMSAPIEAGINQVTGANNPLLKQPSPSMIDLYKQARDEERTKNIEAQKANPATYGASEFAGAVLPTLIPGVAESVPAMSALGAAAGLGSATGTPLEQAKSTALGATVGWAGGLGGKAIGGVARNIVAPAARRALGFTKPMLRNLPGGMEQAEKVGTEMLNQGVIKNPILHPWKSGTKGMVEAATALKDVTGKEIGSIRTELQDAGQKAFSPLEIATEVNNQLMPIETGGAYTKEAEQVKEVLDTILAHNPLDGSKIDYTEASKLMNKLKTLSNFKSKTPTDTELKIADLYKRAYGIASDYLDTATEEGLNTIGKPELMAQYTKAMDLYSKTKTALSTLNEKQLSELARNPVSLYSIIAAVKHGAFGLAAELAARRGAAAGATLGSGLSQNAPSMAGAITIPSIRQFVNPGIPISYQSPQIRKIGIPINQ